MFPRKIQNERDCNIETDFCQLTEYIRHFLNGWNKECCKPREMINRH